MIELPDVGAEPRHLGALGRQLWRGAAVVGGATLAASVALAALQPEGWRRFFFAYLQSFVFFLSLSLGALYFVVLHHLTRAGWSVVVRRIAEALAAVLPFMLVLFVPRVLGLRELYPWARPEVIAHDPTLQHKAAYLNVPFFVIRCVFYLAVWGLLARYFLRRSLAQDASGDARETLQMQSRSAPAMVAFALTLTFGAFDLLMSLEPHWYSTIFGVYYFAGAAVGIYALLPLLAFGLQSRGLLRRAITVEHYHDMGKLLFGFVVFWAYIAFSQYMLIWYANIPEETRWLLRRQQHGWEAVGLVLIFGHFIVPFAALLSRAAKRRPAVLAVVAMWILAMHWVDLYWLVMPEGSPASPLPHLLDLTILVGLGGVWLAAVAFAMRERSLLPERDPRLAESLAFENA
ncbi:MAG: quinol:cytochrome C oxidoreductase [Thermoanaerobaculales bacterium]